MFVLIIYLSCEVKKKVFPPQPGIGFRTFYYLIAYEFTKIENKKCDVQRYGDFTNIESAKKACISEGKNCSSVYDVGCGIQNRYHLCPTNSTKQSTDSCTHLKMVVGKIS